ncbi:MAG: porin family protein [Saprospiraceae bacterium]|jgi:hypothetical protein|nr:PorT family protein [Saprospiraceae bacterium]
MKHILVTSIAFLMSLGTVKSQHINIGIKGGLNAFSIATDNTTTNDTKLSYNLGLLGHIHLSRQWAFQPELVYSVQGTSYKSGGVDSKLNLNYLNIPLNIQYMFDNGFRLQAGPQIGILTGANLKSGSSSTDVKSSFKGTDIGLTLGISYVQPSTGMGIDGRYNHGLTNINAANSTNSFNRGVQLTLFYLFGHKS